MACLLITITQLCKLHSFKRDISSENRNAVGWKQVQKTLCRWIYSQVKCGILILPDIWGCILHLVLRTLTLCHPCQHLFIACQRNKLCRQSLSWSIYVFHMENFIIWTEISFANKNGISVRQTHVMLLPTVLQTTYAKPRMWQKNLIFFFRH